MRFEAPLAWLQLKREPARFSVALAGVAFAVILVFMQFGFYDALFRSAVRLHERLQTDLVLISPKSLYLAGMKSFSRRRLYQALGFDGVEAVAPIYAGLALWKSPGTGKARPIFVVGFDPKDRVLDLPGVRANLEKIRLPDMVLFDRDSRPEYGPIAGQVEAGKLVTTEVSDRQVTVVGVFQLGTSFGIDGTLITSDLNFRRLFPNRQKGLIDIGLIKLEPGVNAEAVRRALETALPRDVTVLTKNGYAEHEKSYWRAATPIGFVFTFGAIMAIVVGGVIVYQVLFTDISSHLKAYATLKAMGYTNLALIMLVFQEALILAVFGYLPGIAAAVWLFRSAGRATLLPMLMSWSRLLEVLALTGLMCSIAGAMALRKIRSADPAEVF
jgi:putative ABC transport system permease protein